MQALNCIYYYGKFKEVSILPHRDKVSLQFCYADSCLFESNRFLILLLLDIGITDIFVLK